MGKEGQTEELGSESAKNAGCVRVPAWNSVVARGRKKIDIGEHFETHSIQGIEKRRPRG